MARFLWRIMGTHGQLDTKFSDFFSNWRLLPLKLSNVNEEVPLQKIETVIYMLKKKNPEYDVYT